MTNILDDILGGAPPPKPAPDLLPIADIRRDGATQPRAGLNENHVADLVQALQDGEPLPAVDVMFDGTDYWLYDGYHRVAAHERVGRTQIAAFVHQGDQPAAQWESYGVNKAHGLKRTNDDKKRAVQAALRHPKAAALSNREIARHVGVDEATVRGYRAQMQATAEIPQSAERKGADGRTINTAGIGKTRTKAQRAAELEPAVMDYARTWRNAQGISIYDYNVYSAAHRNGQFWASVTKHLKRCGVDYELDPLTLAIKAAVEKLHAERGASKTTPASLDDLPVEDSITVRLDADGKPQMDWEPEEWAAAQVQMEAPPARAQQSLWQPAQATAKPGELPADLQARGWELRRVGGVGKWYANNRAGSRATGVHEKAQDAIAEAYTMQRDLAWASQGVTLEGVTATADNGRLAVLERERPGVYREAVGKLRMGITELDQARIMLLTYNRDACATLDTLIAGVYDLIGDLQP